MLLWLFHTKNLGGMSVGINGKGIAMAQGCCRWPGGNEGWMCREKTSHLLAGATVAGMEYSCI
jgi:hypothetical protein